MSNEKCPICGYCVCEDGDRDCGRPFCRFQTAKRDLEVEKRKFETMLKLVAIGDECPPGTCPKQADAISCVECWRKHVDKEMNDYDQLHTNKRLRDSLTRKDQ